MTKQQWEVSMIRYCDRVGHPISLEVKVVYPPEYMPDHPPRVVARRCSNAVDCNGIDKAACAWCGTNPDYRPS
ncbi:MAG: hypothetical protein QM730_25385 [Anaerolineales bacterium]